MLETVGILAVWVVGLTFLFVGALAVLLFVVNVAWLAVAAVVQFVCWILQATPPSWADPDNIPNLLED